MKVAGTRVIKPFDAVVNFNEDFHSTEAVHSNGFPLCDPETTQSEFILNGHIDYSTERTVLNDRSRSANRNNCKTLNIRKCNPRSNSRSSRDSHERFFAQTQIRYPWMSSELSSQRSTRHLSTPPERDHTKPLTILTTDMQPLDLDKRLFLSTNLVPSDISADQYNDGVHLDPIKMRNSVSLPDFIEPYFSSDNETEKLIHPSCYKWNAFNGNGFVIRGCQNQKHPAHRSFLAHNDGASVRGLQSHVTRQILTDYESEVSALRQKLSRRTEEAQTFAEELSSIKRVERDMRAQLNELSYTGSVKAETVLSLKKKLAELYADLESLRLAHAQAIDHEADLQDMVTSLKKSRDWYEEQLSLSQSIRHRLEKETEKFQMLMKDGTEVNHRLIHENACLQAQLACSRASLADAKRHLSHQLESIRVDMIEREVVFERIANERSCLEQLSLQRSDEVNKLQASIYSLKTELKVTNSHVKTQRNRLEELESALSTVEARRTELQKMLQVIETQHQEQAVILNDQREKHATSLTRIKTLETDCAQKDAVISSIVEEKNSVSAAYASACKEKETLNTYLCSLKDNLSHIESSLEKVRVELATKNEQLKVLIEERDTLTRELEMNRTQLLNMHNTVDSLSRDKKELLDSLDLLRANIVCHQLEYAKSEVTVGQMEAAIQTDPCGMSLTLPGGITHANQTDVNPMASVFEREMVNVVVSRDSSFTMASEPRAFDVCSSSSLPVCSPVVSQMPYNIGAPHGPFNGHKISNRSDEVLGAPDHFQEDAALYCGKHPAVSMPAASVSLIRGSLESLNVSPNHTVEESSVRTFGVDVQQPNFVLSDHQHCIISVPPPTTKCDFTSTNTAADVLSFRDPCKPHVEPKMESNLTPHWVRRPDGEEGLDCISRSKITSLRIPLAASTKLADYFSVPTEHFLDEPSESILTKEQQNSSALTKQTSRDVTNEVDVLDSCINDRSSGDSCISSIVDHNELFGVPVMPVYNGISNSSILTSNSKSEFPTKDCNCVWDVERERLLGQLWDAERRASEATIALTIARRDVEAQASVIERETLARQSAVITRQESLAELEDTRKCLRQSQSVCEELTRKISDLQEELNAVNCQGGASVSCSDEVDTLKAIIQTTTSHLTSMSESLNKAHAEKLVHQAELARLKGGIRAQLERFRLFGRLEPPTLNSSSLTVTDALAAIGVDLEGLENLLGEGEEFSLLDSKLVIEFSPPLVLRTLCF